MTKQRKIRASGGMGESRKTKAEEDKPRRGESTKAAQPKPKKASLRKGTRRPVAIGSTAYRNKRDDDKKGKASYALEDNNPAKRPSRKSTRRSSNRQKPDSNLERRQTRRVRSAKNRSQMRGG